LIANASAYTQTSDRRRFPRALQIVGMIGCAILVVTLPWTAVLSGISIFAIGLVYRAIRVRYLRARSS
jgi:APA family basic amino acid/polyamine antiporter